MLFSKKCAYFIFAWLGMVQPSIGECLDVYGVDAKEGQVLLRAYSAEWAALMKTFRAGLKKEAQGFFDSEQGMHWRDRRQALIDSMKAKHDYAYLNLDTMYYGEENYCTTIEVVQSNEPERLTYLPNQEKRTFPKTHDIMDEMQDYLTTAQALFLSNQIHPKHSDCPVYHCTTGFDHPKLKPYLERFNTAAVKQRAFILNTLSKDPNPMRRAQAAYLVGHFQDPNDIVRVLLPYVEDRDEGVRNNVIRVLSLTTQKAHITSIDPTPFIHLLSSPCSTDRNKSLFLLSVLADSTAVRQALIQQAKIPLLNLLRLQQPNQHDFAYLILKKITGQDFGDKHPERWAKWFDNHEKLETHRS